MDINTLEFSATTTHVSLGKNILRRKEIYSLLGVSNVIFCDGGYSNTAHFGKKGWEKIVLLLFSLTLATAPWSYPQGLKWRELQCDPGLLG